MEQPEDNQIKSDYVAWQTGVRLAKYNVPIKKTKSAQHAAEDLATLYATDGANFISLAFKTFLDRPPSEQEIRQWLQELHKGQSKSIIAARLRYSSEAKGKKQSFNLKKALWIDKLTTLPAIGPVFQFFYSLLSVAGMKRSILSQQQTIHALNNHIIELKDVITGNGALSAAIMRDVVTAEEQHKLDQAATSQQLAAIKTTIVQETRYLRDRQFDFEQALSSLSPTSTNDGSGNQGTPVDENFYIAFENYFRGSEETISDRLSYYLPLLDQKLPLALRDHLCVDIGCGRGEWISLLQHSGYAAKGLDLNEKNVASCNDKGLDAELADGIEWLKQTESQSLVLISSFHVIEHLSLPQLHSLVIEAFRCLKPGGLLLLETPNPENLVTAANRFYTDPSHRNPIPPDLMEFLLKYKGFKKVEIHRIHPCEETHHFTGDTVVEERLNELFYGPQDYAILAAKP